MPIYDRDWYRSRHPSSCTCVECTNKRLRRLRKEAHPNYISFCPKCGKKSLFYNGQDKIYECLNLRCKVSGHTLYELKKYNFNRYMTPKETDKAVILATERQRNTYNYKAKSIRRKRGWLIPLLILSIFLIPLGFYYWNKTYISNTIPSPITETPTTQKVIPPTSPPVIPTPPSPITIVPPPTVEYSPITETETEPSSGRVWLNEYAYLVGGDWEPIILFDNPMATNPTYAKLNTFLQEDSTDEYLYGISQEDGSYWICGDFAEALHNNAEASEIRAGYVALEGVDHALNVFETIDQGLVFVDCTGDYQTIHRAIPPWQVEFGNVTNWDKIAYIQEGKPLCFISLEVAQLYGFQYSGYETWTQKKVLFDLKLDEYVKQAGDRLRVSKNKYRQLMKQLEELEDLGNQLGGFWEQEGIVNKVNIFWSGE